MKSVIFAVVDIFIKIPVDIKIEIHVIGWYTELLTFPCTNPSKMYASFHFFYYTFKPKSRLFKLYQCFKNYLRITLFCTIS